MNEADGYSDYSTSSNSSVTSTPDEEEEEEEEDDDEEEDFIPSRYSNMDHLVVFGDPSTHFNNAASIDCRNSIDLRDVGLSDSDDEQRRRESTLLDLKSSAKSSDDDLTQLRRHHHHHHHHQNQQQQRRHHHHHHHVQQQQQHHHHHRVLKHPQPPDAITQLNFGSGSGGGDGCSGADSDNPGNESSSANTNTAAHAVVEACASGGAGFNFRFTDDEEDKWRSAPSLPASFLAESSSISAIDEDDQCRSISVPIDLHLCRYYTAELVLDNNLDVIDKDDDEIVIINDTATIVKDNEINEQIQEIVNNNMAEVVAMNHSGGEVSLDEHNLEPGKIVGEEKLKLRRRGGKEGSSVKTQNPQNKDVVIADLVLNNVENADDQTTTAAPSEEDERPTTKQPLTPTVKTQDRIESKVMEIAMAMENDVDAVVDEAIRKLKRQVVEATTGGNNVEALAAVLEEAQRHRSSVKSRVKNNASYELAQQATVDDHTLRKITHPEAIKVLKNVKNASYELAIQNDVLRNMAYMKPFQRMDACEEEAEGASNSSQYRLEQTSPQPSPRKHPKSPEKIGTNKRSQQEASDKNPVGLLGQLKKNSDLFSPSGEQHAADEADYAANYVETKPIIDPNHSSSNHQNVLHKNLDEEDNDDDDGYVKRSFIGEYYTMLNEEQQRKQQQQQQQQQSREVSKSCEDVAGEQRSEKKKKEMALPPLRPVGCMLSTQSAARLPLVDSSPADLLEESSTTRVELTQSGTLSPVKGYVAQATVAGEMSATAAKRLAMSGDQQQQQQHDIKSTSSINTSNGQRNKEEKKKGGFGGFLQRFSRLRFSGRSKVPRSEVSNKKGGSAGSGATNSNINNNKVSVHSNEVQQVNNKDKRLEPKYVIIPLRAPEDEQEEEEDHRRNDDDFNNDSSIRLDDDRQSEITNRQDDRTSRRDNSISNFR